MFDGEIYHASMMQTSVAQFNTEKKYKKRTLAHKNVGLIKSCDKIDGRKNPLCYARVQLF